MMAGTSDLERAVARWVGRLVSWSAMAWVVCACCLVTVQLPAGNLAAAHQYKAGCCGLHQALPMTVHIRYVCTGWHTGFDCGARVCSRTRRLHAGTVEGGAGRDAEHIILYEDAVSPTSVAI